MGRKECGYSCMWLNCACLFLFRYSVNGEGVALFETMSESKGYHPMFSVCNPVDLYDFESGGHKLE